MKKLNLAILTLFIGFQSYSQVTITHNNSQFVVPNNGITCAESGTAVTSYNRYFGLFDLANDFEITNDWTIEAIEIGIEDANNILNEFYPIYINAYTTDDGTPNGNLTVLGGDTLYVSIEDELTVVSMPLPDNIVVPAGEILLVEIEVFDDKQSVFRLGSTNIESNDESWGHAPSCGFPVPITYTDAGFLNTWNIMNVVGDVTVGVEEIFSNQLMVYPNPNSGNVNVLLPPNFEMLNSELYDLAGKDTGVEIIDGKMDTSNLVNGIYILRVMTTKGMFVQKISKQ